MRKYMLCMMLGVAAGCAEQTGSAPTASAPTSADLANAVALVKFTCPTMHWGGCRSTVTSTLESLPGVAKLNIDAEERTVIVSGNPETFVVDDAVAALKKCGFPAEETEALTGS